MGELRSKINEYCIRNRWHPIINSLVLLRQGKVRACFSSVCSLVLGKMYRPKYKTINYSYQGEVNNEKRYMSVGYDDFRQSDFEMIIPIYNKYGFKAEFNKVFSNYTMTLEEKKQISQVIKNGHELGNHTWLHKGYIYSYPLWNGQDFHNSDGFQEPYPSNADMREDRGDGKNSFGVSLDEKVTVELRDNVADIDKNTIWRDLNDCDCQKIRELFSLYSGADGSIWLLDGLSNKYLKTKGNSRDSWSAEKGCYTGGIYTGCKTSANHEVWERILKITECWLKSECPKLGKMKVWSLPGFSFASCFFEKEGVRYYDRECTIIGNYSGKIYSSLYGERSWVDVLRQNGYTSTHDSEFPSRCDGTKTRAVRRRFILNAGLSRIDGLSYPSEHTIYYFGAGEKYTEEFFGQSNKTYAEQLYEDGGDYYKFIEAIRCNTSNGIIHEELIDSYDSYGDRVFLTEMLNYCKNTGVEVITKSEAFDICFHHTLKCENLIYNPFFRNTAKEFLPNANNVPANPDGYVGDCYVSEDENSERILHINGITEYLHCGIPLGLIRYSCQSCGKGDIKIYEVKNNSDVELCTSYLALLGEMSIDRKDFGQSEILITIRDNPIGMFEQSCEGWGDKIMGIKIVYSGELLIKQINLASDSVSAGI